MRQYQIKPLSLHQRAHSFDKTWFVVCVCRGGRGREEEEEGGVGGRRGGREERERGGETELQSEYWTPGKLSSSSPAPAMC